MQFRHVCDLLEELSAIATRYPPYLPKDAERRSNTIIVTWFSTHRNRINSEASVEPLFSTLLPERRTDRVYSLKEQSLEKIVGRILGLSSGRCSDLARYRQPGAGDLGDCVERVQKQVEQQTSSRDDITVEEIDKALVAVASQNQFSSPSVRALAVPCAVDNTSRILASILHRLNARNSKWFIRLVLKNFSPVTLPETLIFKSYHGLLPMMLKVQAEVPAALALLDEWKRSRNGETDPFMRFRPIVGVKVGRQTFTKARSIKHCCDMAQGRKMSVEKKYDGEYCQIHIDMSKPLGRQIKIFSKSGKDSTNDRIRVHGVIRKALRLDEADCLIRQQCIIEGELLVYNDHEGRIAEFHKIRKHVSRSGLYIGTAQDSQRHHFEHLMIVFFDVLMHDEKQVLSMKQIDRRFLLQSLVSVIKGRAEVAESHLLAFANREAAGNLRALFTKCINAHEEGMVMKPADDPYFNFEGGLGFKSTCIKMKKEYISTFGDVGDFAVVGASYDAVKAKEYNLPNLKWTHFWLGCMENKEAVTRWSETPRFVIVGIVSPNATIVKSLMSHACPNPVPAVDNSTFAIRIEPGIRQGQQLTTIFTNPLVFDMRCFAFDKEGDVGFWTPRFPQATKLHLDRSYLDTVSFSELQEMAEKASTSGSSEADKEDARWLERLRTADPRQIAIDASTQQTTQRTASSATTTPEKNSPLRLVVAANENNKFVLALDKSCKRKSYLDVEPKPPRKRRCSIIHSQPLPSLPVPGLLSWPSAVSEPQRPQRKEALADITSSGSQASNKIRPLEQTKVRIQPREVIEENVRISTPVAMITGTDMTPPDTNHRIVSGGQAAAKAKMNSSLALATQLTKRITMQTSPVQGNQVVSTPLMNNKTLVMTPPDTTHHQAPCTSSRTLKPIVEATVPTTMPSCLLSQLHPPSTNTPRIPQNIFKDCKFYLSPCISSTPYLTQTLLAKNCLTYSTTAQHWLDSNFCQRTGIKLRKILLVEPKRKNETHTVLRDLQAERKRLGAAGRVEIYDWRIVEDFVGDGGSSRRRREEGFNPWKRHWVGCLT